MTIYKGTIFGHNYNVDLASDEEFVNWLFILLKRKLPTALWEMIISKLLRQSDEYQAAKAKIAEFESRISALELG